MSSITLSNQTTNTVYVYNFNYGAPAAVTALVLAAKGSGSLCLSDTDQMRIYVADQPLKNSVEQGLVPDPFNATLDGNVMYSFAEYTSDANQYTIDVSYINEFSFPLTLTFSNFPAQPVFTGAVANFEYGFKSLSAVMQALNKLTKPAWSALIWPVNPVTTWPPAYPANIYRIIGPLNAWLQQQANPSSPIGPWEPDSYQSFINSLPFNGKELFNTQTNLDGWNNDVTAPANTAYVQALRSAATADANQKYGFFCYPQDNASGQFTNVPNSISCTLTIYSYSD